MTDWKPLWSTGPDQSKKEKESLQPTVSFVEDGFRGSPAPQSIEERKQAEKNRAAFLESFRENNECFGVRLKRDHAQDADFGLQIFNGIEGRTGRWQWVLYRMDTTAAKAHGEATGSSPDGIAESICSTIRDAMKHRGGDVE